MRDNPPQSSLLEQQGPPRPLELNTAIGGNNRNSLLKAKDISFFNLGFSTKTNGPIANSRRYTFY